MYKLSTLLILISFQVPLYSALSTTIIKSCYDGDTCTAVTGEKIRLACIDTPELKGKNANKIPAKEARDFLNQLVANKKVSIKRMTKDRYGRTVAEIYKDGTNIQELIVNKGYGKIYKRYSYQCEWAKWIGIYFTVIYKF